jgi:hypothetical protein
MVVALPSLASALSDATSRPPRGTPNPSFTADAARKFVARTTSADTSPGVTRSRVAPTDAYATRPPSLATECYSSGTLIPAGGASEDDRGRGDDTTGIRTRGRAMEDSTDGGSSVCWCRLDGGTTFVLRRRRSLRCATQPAAINADDVRTVSLGCFTNFGPGGVFVSFGQVVSFIILVSMVLCHKAAWKDCRGTS